MRKTLAFSLAATVVAAVGCSDRSPTGPAMGTTTASSEAATSSSEAIAAGRMPGPVARPRNAIVVPPRANNSLPPGVWGSAEASLAVGPSGATLEILSANLPNGACFGKYGDVITHVPGGRFSLPGTFTQLIGAYPGKIQYPAAYSGIVLGNTISITATVPALQQTFGPYVLVKDVINKWTPCMYP